MMEASFKEQWLTKTFLIFVSIFYFTIAQKYINQFSDILNSFFSKVSDTAPYGAMEPSWGQ